MFCPNGMPYTIKAGDTFYRIAQTYGITVDALMQANPGVNPDRLFIGQVICIPTSGPTPPPTPGSCPTLRQGSRGADVVRLQQLLLGHGFNPGAIDGIFGPNTHSAVVAFQRSRGLTPDGIVGINTWTALGVNCSGGPTPGHCPAGTFAYTIRSGDTLYILAQRYRTTVDAIMRVNPGINPNNLQIGQVICIPQQ
ncbi:LysM peptidoglycan-binding domain-containing protein [Tissierella pigra]|nr:LysM peptidoglycan-binding domain-containing protein [Tissierella pigra]MBU5427876.1 LysM peptidoglycan-binding domain-containing protein [Tissierella pigra]